MNKKYKYNGKIFCDDDLSVEIENYGGYLYDLFNELQKDGSVVEETIYYTPSQPEQIYDSVEDLIEDRFKDLEAEE